MLINLGFNWLTSQCKYRILPCSYKKPVAFVYTEDVKEELQELRQRLVNEKKPLEIKQLKTKIALLQDQRQYKKIKRPYFDLYNRAIYQVIHKDRRPTLNEQIQRNYQTENIYSLPVYLSDLKLLLLPCLDQVGQFDIDQIDRCIEHCIYHQPVYKLFEQNPFFLPKLYTSQDIKTFISCLPNTYEAN